jgi:hypothetical protein
MHDTETYGYQLTPRCRVPGETPRMARGVEAAQLQRAHGIGDRTVIRRYVPYVSPVALLAPCGGAATGRLRRCAWWGMRGGLWVALVAGEAC